MFNGHTNYLIKKIEKKSKWNTHQYSYIVQQMDGYIKTYVNVCTQSFSPYFFLIFIHCYCFFST